MGDRPERRKEFIEFGKMQASIELIAKEQPKIREDIATLRESVSALKVYAGILGFISGAISTIALWAKISFSKGGQG